MIFKFLLNLLFLYAAWQIIKFIFRVALANWIRKNAGKSFQFNGGFGRGFQQEPQRPVGEIRVESTGNPKSKSNGSQQGEYIDFEEVS